MKDVAPDDDYDCDSPRSFVSAQSDLDRAAVRAGDWEARSPRRSSMEAVTEEGHLAKTGTQRLQLSPTAAALLRQARTAITGELLIQPALTRAHAPALLLMSLHAKPPGWLHAGLGH